MRILLVDDEVKFSSVLRSGLEEHGYAVDLAHDGEQGYHLASMEPYDLVILDVMLPVMDGLHVCRRLRAERCNIPILMLTARDAVDDRVAGLDCGADDYLTKPFAFRELLARLRALSRRTGAPHPQFLQVADIV